MTVATEDTHANQALTESRYWDEHWGRVRLPAEIKKGPRSLLINEICACFDKYLPKDPALSALEIGGAPGQYLVYMHRTFGYRVACLDYSPTGCRLTRENFSFLGIPVDVYEGDLFDTSLTLPQFDIVYSLGLIEHFSDCASVVSHHLRFLRPGGILMIGCPNLRGIYGWFRRRLTPVSCATWDATATDPDRWEDFEKSEELEIVFKHHVGGFEPAMLAKCERKTVRNLPLRIAANILKALLRRRFAWLRKYNGAWLSGYVLGIYRKPLTASDRPRESPKPG